MRFLQKDRLRSLIANERVLIGILLSTFFLKGMFFAVLFPIFTGQDEARHYNAIQYLNEPKEKTWETEERRRDLKRENFTHYNFSEEILNTGIAAGLDDLRGGLHETTHFAVGSFDGPNESEITARKWLPYNRYILPDIVSSSLYHHVARAIESALSGSDIFIRFYAIRLFSVLLGTLAVFLAYRIARTIGFGAAESFALGAIVAFQPKFATYFTNINYDALLIPMFFLFTWAGVSSLRHGLNWKNLSLLVFSVIVGLLTKGTAIVLFISFIALLGFHLFRRVRNWKKLAISIAIFAAALAAVAIPFSSRYGLASIIPVKGSMGETISGLHDYLDKSLTFGRFGLSSRTYWGALGWNDDFVSGHFTDTVWYVEYAAAAGLLLFFWKRRGADFLPERKYVVFLLLMIAALELGIRAADFSVFLSLHTLNLGTPGRYFLPNLATHILLVFIGLGALLGTRDRFRNALRAGVVFMVCFSLYLTLDVILPRFYL